MRWALQICASSDEMGTEAKGREIVRLQGGHQSREATLDCLDADLDARSVTRAYQHACKPW